MIVVFGGLSTGLSVLRAGDYLCTLNRGFRTPRIVLAMGMRKMSRCTSSHSTLRNLVAAKALQGAVGEEVGQRPHRVGKLVGQYVAQEGEAYAHDHRVPSRQIARQKCGRHQLIAVKKEP